MVMLQNALFYHTMNESTIIMGVIGQSTILNVKKITDLTLRDGIEINLSKCF